jgi:hypothetical protein
MFDILHCGLSWSLYDGWHIAFVIPEVAIVA